YDAVLSLAPDITKFSFAVWEDNPILITKVPNKGSPDEYINTSCVISGLSLFSAFCGKEHTEKLVEDCLGRTTTFNRYYSLPSGAYFDVSYYGCFDGAVFYNLFQGMSKESVFNGDVFAKITAKGYRHLDEKIDQALKSTSIKTDEVFSLKIQETLKSFQYSFNQKTIELLKREINENSEKTTPEKSFCYFCAIVAPFTRNFHHVFILEQSCEGVRLYQSWVWEATIFQDIEKRKKTMNLKEVELFFEDLEKGYCVSEGSSHVDSMRVFGYETPKLPICEYDEAVQTLGTHVLKFYVAEFDPILACQNIEKIKAKACSVLDS
ncbi:MAG: hypothetical protein JSS09_06170, partial [Verrucomicrobia bacterium]|nr:hypothetical protein [Verrucomicrobiota bacterium]